MNQYAVVAERCVSCGACPAIAPEHFVMPLREKARVIAPPADQDEDRLCRAALDACPVFAITARPAREAT